MTPPVFRVANCSGFYGDRLSAMREVIEGGPVDVVTGDYLAELTMLILGRDQIKDASLGYARTFVTQVEECIGLALEKGIRIVSNAGGLNPAGHVIECGTQATGGNFSGFRQLFHNTGTDLSPLGFPIAELEPDGSCVITKHEGTGGAVTVDTVTAQLVYEVQSTRYLGPDVTMRLDSLELALGTITPDLVRRLVPEAEELEVEVFPLPNLHAVNVVVHDLLGEGVAASSRFDPQAKGLGEWVRSRFVDIPEGLLP